MMLRVKDRKSGIIRTVTHRAYAAMGPKVYEKLGEIDATFQAPAAPAPIVHQGNVYRSISAPIVKPQIAAVEGVTEQETGDNAPIVASEVKVKGKPGRKPGSKKSISSNSPEDEK